MNIVTRFLRPLDLWLTRAKIVCMIALVLRPVCAANLWPTDLRCDGLVNPVGVDATPRFSWKLDAAPGARSARQTAWQLRVGAWDSGRVESAEQINLPFSGPPLGSHERIVWRVRVWNESGEGSEWSPEHVFTVGVLDREEWSPAQWITDGELTRWERSRLGYSSKVEKSADALKWLQLDLGSSQPVEVVRLHSLRHTEIENIGFPLRFKLEAADEPEFKAPRLVLDQTTADFGPAWSRMTEVKTPGLTARYLRVTVPRLRMDAGTARLAFSQVEVLSGARNLALGARVTASDSIEDERWGATSVVDGLGVPGANSRANGTLLLRREFALRSPLRRAVLHVSGLGQPRRRRSPLAIEK